MENQEIFLLDANSFITPYKQYYAFDLIVPYWDEIIKYINNGRIVVLDMVKNEIMSGKDELSKWLKNIDSLNTIPHKEINTVLKYQEVIQYVKKSKWNIGKKIFYYYLDFSTFAFAAVNGL